MNPDRGAEFHSAFSEWQANPLATTEENAFLFHSSNALVSVQDDVAPPMVQLHETGQVAAFPVERWHDGMSYLLIRETDRLRRHLRLGRNQVSTRTLIDGSLRLQRAWDAYRRLIGK